MARRGTGEDFTLEKALPNNVEAERYILGAILLENTTLNQAAERLKPEDFFLVSHRRIFEKMLNLFEAGRGIDPITLQEELRRGGELDLVGGPAYLASLFDGVPRFSNIENYVKIVKGKSTLRRLINASNHIMAKAFDDEDSPEEILDEAERLILAIAEDRIKQGFVHIGEVAAKQLEAIEEIAGREQLITGIATGFHELDYMTSGLQRGDLIIVAARPSMGKTAFSLNIAQNAATTAQHHGEPAVVGVFSLEMGNEQLVNRLICSQARVDAHRLRSGYLSKEEWRRLATGVGELSQAQIFLDDTPGISVLEMRAKARRLKNEQKRLDMLIVDYLQLMTGRGKTDSRQQEVSQISRELKMLAKELNVPLVALSQLSRAPETRTGNHKPQLSDLRESGCLTGDTLITLADSGRRVPLRDLVGRSGFAIWALNEQTWQIEPAIASRSFSTGVKPVFRLTTRLGRTIRATANHPFRAFGEWKRLDELAIGDRIAMPRLGEQLMAEAGLGTASSCIQTYQQNVGRERAVRLANAVHSDAVMRLAESDVYWDEIVSIQPDGVEEVYDLTVEKHHNFVADDIIVHNSIEQDADVVMFLYRDEVYHPDTTDKDMAEVIVAKHRAGRTGVARLVFLDYCTLFANMARTD